MSMANISGPSAPAIVDHGKSTPVGVRPRSALDKVTGEPAEPYNALGVAKHGIGQACDHTGHLTGVEGKSFDVDMRLPLQRLRLQRNDGHISADEHAAGITSILERRFRFDGKHVVVY
jgi:hypothetical protein